MPRIRSEFHFRRTTETLSETVDITTYDRIGRLTTDAEAALSTTGESGAFLFDEGGSAADTVTVLYLGSAGGHVQLKLSGSGVKGDKLAIGANGVIQQSTTPYADEAAETDLGVALSNWTDGEATECQLYKI